MKTPKSREKIKSKGRKGKRELFPPSLGKIMKIMMKMFLVYSGRQSFISRTCKLEKC